MKKTIQLVATLTIFCVVVGFLLAWTNSITKAPIETALKKEMIAALSKVLPEHDNDIVTDVKAFKDKAGKEWTFYVARLKGTYRGTAFCSTSERGYGGTIEVLVGVLPDAAVNGMEILRADKETPGLGSKIREQGFRIQFKGKSASDTKWAAVTKDGGQIDAVTGATISSRAVTEAVSAGLKMYAIHAAEITGAEKRSAGKH